RIGLGQARGQEQRGRRLGLVVSPSESPLSVVTVIPASTSAQPAIHRPELGIASRRARRLADQPRSIDIGEAEIRAPAQPALQLAKRARSRASAWAFQKLRETGFLGKMTSKPWKAPSTTRSSQATPASWR